MAQQRVYLPKDERSYKVFLASIKTTATKKNYEKNLDHFMQFCGLCSYDDLIKKERLWIMQELQDYMMMFKERHGKGEIVANTVRSCFWGIKLFLEQNDVDLNFKKITRMIPESEESSGTEPYSTEDIKAMLEHTNNLRNKAVILFFASTGVRPGAIYDEGNYLRFGETKSFEDGCMAVQIYPGTKHKYWVILIPEASQALNKYRKQRESEGETITEDSPLFKNMDSKDVIPLRDESAYGIVLRATESAGIRVRGKNNQERHEKRMIYGFRIRFDTILKNMDNPVLNPNLVEKLMGHSVTIPLDQQYHRPTIERLHAEIDKATSELTIDQSKKYKMQYENAKVERSDYEKLKAELDGVKKAFLDSAKDEETREIILKHFIRV